MMTANNRKATLQVLHTAAINKAVMVHERNLVLDGRLLPNCNSDKYLTRKECPTLAQFRSRYCGHLGSYKRKIKKDQSFTVCTDCGITPHDVKQLIVFPTHSTTMTPSNLWISLAEAVRELG